MPNKKSDAAEQTVAQTNELRELLRTVAPECPLEVLATIAIDLVDLAAVAARHQETVQGLLELPNDLREERLRKLLANVDVDLLFEADFHMKSLKTYWPQFVEYLDSETTE